MTEIVLRAAGIGRRFGRTWALRECDVELPRGRIAALLGRGGAGKTTLMRLATGLLAPTAGRIEVLGTRPGSAGAPPGLSYLAQEKPLYRAFRVSEMLRAGAALNSRGRWDGAHAQRLVTEAGVPLDARIDSLSGGQRTRVALAIALGRRPELLLLDEPLADLDPLARREAMQSVLVEVAETGMTVLMSSHVISDLDDVCDHAVLLRDGRTALAGDVDDLLDAHRVITGPAGPIGGTVIERRTTGKQLRALVRTSADPLGFRSTRPDLETLVLGYLQVGSAAPVAEVVS